MCFIVKDIFYSWVTLHTVWGELICLANISITVGDMVSFIAREIVSSWGTFLFLATDLTLEENLRFTDCILESLLTIFETSCD